MDGRGPPSSSFLRQQRFRDLLRSPTLTHSWPVFDPQNMERPCEFWQNSPKRWTVGLGKLTALCGSLSAQLAQPLLSHGLPRAFLCYFLNPDGNSLNESELSEAAKLQLVRRLGLHKLPQLQRWLDGYAICGDRTVP